MSSIVKTQLQTARLNTCFRSAGSSAHPTVVLVHGNVSSSRFFERTMLALASDYHVIAPDFRGYGESETKDIDATRGVRDFSDDLYALLDALGELSHGKKVHLVGWSVGGGVIMQFAMDHADAVASLSLIAPMSPFGFGGTRDASGTPCFDDFAGSGGGTANPDFVARLGSGDRTEESPTGPRNVMNAFYFKPPFRSDEEEDFLSSMLTTKTVPGVYPGDLTMSTNWPTLAPGNIGMNNAISAKWCNLGGFANISPRPPVFWIRGDSDQIVSDTSLFDFGFLGQLGAIPGWPGADVFPAQPMVSQTRHVLDAYRSNGGSYQEVVVEGCGHSPHIEHPEVYLKHQREFLAKNR